MTSPTRLLDLLASDAEKEQDGVEVGRVEGCVGRGPHHGLGVEGDAQTGSIEHVEVIGTVADSDGARQGNRELRGESLEGLSFAAAIDDIAQDAPREASVDDLERVGTQPIDLELFGQRCNHLGESARDEAHAKAQSPERATQGAGARRQANALRRDSECVHTESGEQGHPPSEGLSEIDLTAHGALGDRGNLLEYPILGGEKVDDLVLDESQIDVHDDEPLTPAVKAGMLDRDIHSERCSDLGQLPPQIGDVLARALEDDGRNRIRGNPADAIDVPSTPGHTTGQFRDGGRRQLLGHHGDVNPSAFGILASDAGPRNRFDLHAKSGRLGMEGRSGVAHRVRGETEEDGEDEASTYDDLLNVQHLATRMPQGIEYRGGDSRAIAPTQDGEKCAVHTASLPVRGR